MTETPVPRDLPPLIRQHTVEEPDTPVPEATEDPAVEEPPC